MTLVFSFLGIAILLTLMPGPDILFVMAQSMAQNKMAGMTTALGLCTGLLVHITAATAGISAIVYQSATVFSIVKYAGAVYLLYLAWQAFHSKANDYSVHSQKGRSYSGLYKKGIIMNILNPKVSLFFLALLPQFVDNSAGFVPLQMFSLGFLFLVQALVIFSLVSFFSEKVRGWLLKNSWMANRMNKIEGAILAAIGLQIALSGK